MLLELTVLMNEAGTKIRFIMNQDGLCIAEATQQDLTADWWVFRSHDDIQGIVNLARHTKAIDMSSRLACVHLALVLATELNTVRYDKPDIETVYRKDHLGVLEDMSC